MNGHACDDGGSCTAAEAPKPVPPERCSPGCRGWFVSNASNGDDEIQHCQDCHYTPGRPMVYDDDSATLDAARWAREVVLGLPSGYLGSLASIIRDLPDVLAALSSTDYGLLALRRAWKDPQPYLGPFPDHDAARRAVVVLDGEWHRPRLRADACDGCGCESGDGPTAGCTDPDGCGRDA